MKMATREVSTTWGTVYATNVDNGVWFSTTPPQATTTQRTENVLRFDGNAYTLDIQLANTELTETERPRRWDIDGVWHISNEDLTHGLRRHPDGRIASIGAHVALRRQFLPELSTWLFSKPAMAMFEEHLRNRHDHYVQLATTGREHLRRSLERVERLHAGLSAGSWITTDDATFLRYLNDEFRVATSHAIGPSQRSQPDVSAPARRPPEPGGLGL